MDWQVNDKDPSTLILQFTRSWFQTPNSFDQQNARVWASTRGLGPNGLTVGPADQRSQIKTFNIAPSWNHLISDTTLFTLGAYVRRDQYNYYPSANPFSDYAPDLQSESVGQNRTLTNAGLRSDLSYVKGIHNLKTGVNYQQTFLDEHDSLGIVDPTLAASSWLLPYNLALNRSATPYVFNGHTDVKELALYIQDTITKGQWSFNLGVRGDFYNGLTTHREGEPRVGVAYNIKKTNTILRASYARLLETPFNENLVLASVGCSNPVLNPLLGCSNSQGTPLSPGWRNEFHVGLQQAFGKYLVFSGEYIWKYTHNAYDFSVLGNTPITFPIEWHSSKIPGFMGRVSVPNLHGFSAYAVFSSVAARFFTPQIGGAGATPSAPSGVFRIDHDEHFNATTHIQYQPWKRGPWLGFNWRYDSGLVAGQVPCYGVGPSNDCPQSTTLNGMPAINMTTTTGVPLTADQEFQAGFYCGGIHATPTRALPFTCLASQFGSTLVKVPAPGTENDDKNPPRINPRHLFDLTIGDDDLFHGEKYKWSAQFTIINLANNYALYNFLSTFSGTHYVTPRSFSAQLGFHF